MWASDGDRGGGQKPGVGRAGTWEGSQEKGLGTKVTKVRALLPKLSPFPKSSMTLCKRTPWKETQEGGRKARDRRERERDGRDSEKSISEKGKRDLIKRKR